MLYYIYDVLFLLILLCYRVFPFVAACSINSTVCFGCDPGPKSMLRIEPKNVLMITFPAKKEMQTKTCKEMVESFRKLS